MSLVLLPLMVLLRKTFELVGKNCGLKERRFVGGGGEKNLLAFLIRIKRSEH